MRRLDLQRVRPPAVAGTFYPGEPGELAAAVRAHLAEATPAPRRPKAVIAPHAGYRYSGPVAGTAFRALAADLAGVRRAVVIGPAHRVRWRGLALPGGGRYSTPLGATGADPATWAGLLELPGVTLSEVPHRGEHSVEVEVPFLQQLLPEVELVPLVAGDARPEAVAAALEAVWGGDETVIVVSSDLSHFLDQERARVRDAETAEAILGLELGLDPRQACGAVPINGLHAVARRRGMTAELLDLRTSADTAGGPERVVGYGAFAYYEEGA